jgi:hypothetical protein
MFVSRGFRKLPIPMGPVEAVLGIFTSKVQVEGV